MLANGRSQGSFLLWMISSILLLLVTLNGSWGWMGRGGGGGQQSPSVSRRQMFQRVGSFVFLIGSCAASGPVQPAVAVVPSTISTTATTTTSHSLNNNNNNNTTNKRISDPVLSSHLVAMIPTTMACGAPATNATIASDLSSTIEQVSFQLEALGQRDNAMNPDLSGDWRLLYSNAAEICSLAANHLPLGLCLGPTYQPIDTTNGYFENHAPLLTPHPFSHLAQLEITVIGTVQVAPANSINAVQVVNDRNNRVEVEFQAISFSLQEWLGISTTLQKTLIPQRDTTKTATPANDVTYLDQNVRIARGGDGSLFIFVREEADDHDDKQQEDDKSTNQRRQQQRRKRRSMLTQEERDALIAGQEQKRGGPERVNVGIGVAETSPNSPELRFLFQNR
jgi:hypothetical protein